MVLPEEGLLLAFSAFAVLAGVFLALTSLALGLDLLDRMRVFYLGAIVATAGLWKLCGLSVVPLLLDYYGHQQALWFIGIISYLLMMVFSLRLLTLLREAKVQAMINQIRPHFLYNTLVTIYDLCKDAPEQAMSAILDFTRYL